MTAAPVLRRPDQASTPRATRSPTPLTCSCACLTAASQPARAEFPVLAISAIPVFVPA
jgi:hypothetical protein